MEIVKLKKRGLEKVERGHLWIFKDEIEETISDRNSGIANIFYKDQFIGKGLYNGRTNNALKFLTSKDEDIDINFFKKRFVIAQKRRYGLSSFRREINSEGDLLPGLIVDRFNNTLVVQIRALAFESLKDKIIDALIDLYSPSSIYERSDFESLPEEGLSRYKGLLYGKEPQNEIVEENGLKFSADVVRGQKTGFFYDQRDSRFFVKKIASAQKALDLFTYTGGFALNMASAGMKVDAVDISQDDLEIGRTNAKMNGLNVNFMLRDAFDLKDLGIYDLVVADPPSLIKRKEERQKAFNMLSNLVDQIFDHIEDTGHVCLCSCAYNIDAEMLEKIVLSSATKKMRTIRPLGWTGLPMDHPHLLSMPETNYLKCFWFESFSKKIL